MLKSSQSPEPYGRSGFTLIEMLFSLALLLLITSFATSAVAKWLESRMLLNTAETLVCELEALRVSAIEDSVDVAFQIMGGKNEFTVEVIGSSASKRSGHIREDGVVFGTSEDRGHKSTTIHFRKDGTADEAQILLSDKAGRQIKIRIHRLTGPEVEE